MIKSTYLPRLRSALDTPGAIMALTFTLLAGCLSTAMPGTDARAFFLRSWFAETSAPGWVYLITDPLSSLPFELAYALWVMITVGVVLVWARVRGISSAWALLSFPLVWLVYIGQIEAFCIGGFLLAAWAVRGRKHPAWLALAALLLLSKLGVGWLPALYLFYAAWQRGPAEWGRMVAAFGAMVAFSIFAVGDWISPWISTLVLGADGFAAGAWRDGSLWPWGLGFALAALLPFRRISPTQRLTLLAAASPLAFPYLRTYHLVLSLLLALPVARMVGEGDEKDRVILPLALTLISWVFLFWPEGSYAYGIILFGVVFYGIWKSTRNWIGRPGCFGRGQPGTDGDGQPFRFGGFWRGRAVRHHPDA